MSIMPFSSMSFEKFQAAVHTALNPVQLGKQESLKADQLLKADGLLAGHAVQCLSQPGLEDQVFFYCLCLLETYCRMATYTPVLRENILKFLLSLLDSGRTVPNFIKNKLAQVVCLCIMQEYGTTWQSAFKDMISWWMRSSAHADMFLKICWTLNEDMIGMNVSDEKVVRMKDWLRERDIPQLVHIWGLLLTDHSQPLLVKQALRCISGYACWIDVNLTANPDLLSRIYACLANDSFRSKSVECLTGIVAKGMPVLEKLKLIVYLNLPSVFSGALQLREEDEEFFEKTCRLLGECGVSLYSTAYTQEIADYYIQVLIPVLITYLEACLSIPECLLSLAQMCTVVPEYFKGGRPFDANLFLKLFNVFILVCKYPVDYDFECPGEDEELFPEIRQAYAVPFDHCLALLGSAGNDFMLSFISENMTRTDDQKAKELAVFLAFRYCDAHRGYMFSVQAPGGVKKLTLMIK